MLRLHITDLLKNVSVMTNGSSGHGCLCLDGSTASYYIIALDLQDAR